LSHSGTAGEFSSGQGSSGPANLGYFSGQRSEFRARVQFFIRFSVQVAMGGNALRASPPDLKNRLIKWLEKRWGIQFPYFGEADSLTHELLRSHMNVIMVRSESFTGLRDVQEVRQ